MGLLCIKKHCFHFSKYTLVGVIATGLNISLMWLCVDLLGFSTGISTAIIIAFVFFFKFYAYVLIKLFHKSMKKFLTVNIGSAIANFLSVWALIEFGGISAVISSTIVVIVLFAVRFVVFKYIGLIRE